MKPNFRALSGRNERYQVKPRLYIHVHIHIRGSIYVYKERDGGRMHVRTPSSVSEQLLQPRNHQDANGSAMLQMARFTLSLNAAAPS